MLAHEAVRLTDDTFANVLDNMLNGVAYCRMLYEDTRPTDWVYLYVNSAFGAQTGLADVRGRRVARRSLEYVTRTRNCSSCMVALRVEARLRSSSCLFKA